MSGVYHFHWTQYVINYVRQHAVISTPSKNERILYGKVLHSIETDKFELASTDAEFFFAHQATEIISVSSALKKTWAHSS